VNELFGRYDERLYAWSFRFSRDHDKALDLAQEAQLEAFRSLGSFEGRSRFSTWLFTIARFRCLRTLRRPDLLRDEGPDPDTLPDAGDPVGAELEAREDDERMIALLREALDARERQALWLRCGEGMPVETITQVLGLDSASGARGLLQTARRKLRAALARRHEQEARQ
jgi:RNA polymerase sigma-70 factor (ECF subfamily)